MGYLVAASFFNKQRQISKDFSILAALFFVSGMINLLASQFHIIALASFLNMIMGLALIFAIAGHTKETYLIKKFIVWAAVANCFYLAIQKFGWNPILNAEITTGEEGAMMGNAANLSTLLAIALPFMMKESVLAWFLLMIVGIVQQEGSLVLICVLYLMVTRPKTFVYMIVAGGAFIFLRWDDILHTSIIGRLDIWRCTIEQTFQSPFWGWGLGNKPLVTSKLHQVVNEKPDYIYSSFLQFMFSTGLIGLISVVAALRTFFKKFTLADEDMSIASIAILSIWKYPFEIQRLWIVICAVIALWIIRVTNQEVANVGPFRRPR